MLSPYNSRFNRTFQDEQLQLDSEVSKVKEQIESIRSETQRKMKELNEARIAQKVRQSQIMRLSSLSRPVDHDTTYIVADKNIAHYAVLPDDDTENFRKKYIKIVRSGELIQLESKRLESAEQVKESFKRLFNKLSETKESKSSAFYTQSAKHKKAENLLRILEKLELQNCFIVKEYLRLRLDVMVMQREEAEAREDLDACRVTFQETETALKKQLNTGVHTIKTKYDKELRLMQHQLEKQLITIREKTESVRIAKEQVGLASETVDKLLSQKQIKIHER